MSAHLNLSTGKFLNSSTLFKLSDALLLDLSSGEIVMSNLLVPRVGVDLFKLASLDLNIAQSKSLTDRVSGNNLVTFTRASTATYVDNNGVIQTASADTPRFDHDPVTGESLGLLMEEASTNLIHYSEPDSGTPDVNSNGNWDFNNLDKNTEIDKVEGPDGVSNSASRMQLLSGTQWDLYVRINNLTAGEKCTFSFLIKLGTATNFAVHVNDTNAWNTVADGRYSFDASDGLNTTSFVKKSLTFTAPTSGKVNIHLGRHQAGIPAQQTAGTVDVWGFQFERNSFATSTIQTSGAAVTRAADVASITGTNFSSWYNQSEGTVFVEASAADTAGVVGFNDGSTDRWRVGFAGDNNAKAAVIVGGVVQTNIVTPNNSTPYNQYHKLCIAIAENNLVFAYNGNALSDNSLSVPSVAGMTIGSAIGIPGRINGHVKRLAYFPTPKTEQESIGLTT